MSENESRFKCDGCGRSFRWKPDYAGKKVKCKCGHVLRVPKEDPSGSQTPEVEEIDIDVPGGSGGGAPSGSGGGNACPECGASMDDGAVLCVECGYNVQTGKKMQMPEVKSDDDEEGDASGGGSVSGKLKGLFGKKK